MYIVLHSTNAQLFIDGGLTLNRDMLWFSYDTFVFDFFSFDGRRLINRVNKREKGGKKKRGNFCWQGNDGHCFISSLPLMQMAKKQVRKNMTIGTDFLQLVFFCSSFLSDNNQLSKSHKFARISWWNSSLIPRFLHVSNCWFLGSEVQDQMEYGQDPLSQPVRAEKYFPRRKREKSFSSLFKLKIV